MLDQPDRDRGTRRETRTYVSSYELLRVVEEQAAIGTWVWDLGTDRQTWSMGLCRIFGFTPGVDEASLELFRSIVHPDDRLLISVSKEQLVRRTEDLGFRILRCDGTVRWLQMHLETIFDRAGRPGFLVGVVVDRTRERSVRKAMTRTEELLNALRSLEKIAIWQADARGALTDTAGLQRMMGLEPNQLVGWRRLEAVHPDDQSAVSAAWAAAVETKSTYESRLRMKLSDGQYRWVDAQAVPVLDAKGDVGFWFGACFMRDGSATTEVPTPAPPEKRKPSGRQLRAARILLEISAEDLAGAAGISLATLRRMEEGGASQVRDRNAAALLAVMEKRGISFTQTPEGACGVSLAPGPR